MRKVCIRERPVSSLAYLFPPINDQDVCSLNIGAVSIRKRGLLVVDPSPAERKCPYFA